MALFELKQKAYVEGKTFTKLVAKGITQQMCDNLIIKTKKIVHSTEYIISPL